MTSRRLIGLIFGALIALSFVAWLTRTSPAPKDRTPLVWTTDPNPARTEQVKQFNQLNPDCQLSIDPDSGDAMKIMVQCSANMGPDLIDHIYYDSNLQTYVEAGILLDLTDIGEENGFGLSTVPENIRPMLQALVLTKDGRLARRQFTYPANVAATYLFYNKKLFRDAGMPDGPPKDMTWDDYIAIAQKLSTPDAPSKTRVYGAAGVSYEKFLMDENVQWFNTWGTVTDLDSEAALRAFRRYHDMIYRYGAEPTPEQQKSTTSTGGWGSGYMSWFGEGRVGMLWGSRWALIQLRRFIIEQRKAREQYLATHPGAGPDEGPQVLEFGCVQVPRPEGKPRYTLYNARCTGVNIQGKHIEQAVRFMRYLAGRDYAETLNVEADSNPGNKEFYNLDFFLVDALPGEEEAHRLAVESIPFGRARASSNFIPNATVNRSVLKVTDKLANTPDLSDAELRELLKKCAYEINLTIARNISRDPRLLKLYIAMLKEGAEPAAEPLESEAAEAVKRASARPETAEAERKEGE